MDLTKWLEKHILWSANTFGTGNRAEGLCKHIESELEEIRREPHDLVVSVSAWGEVWVDWTKL